MRRLLSLCYTACVLRHSGSPERTVDTAPCHLDMLGVPGGKRRRGQISNVKNSRSCHTRHSFGSVGPQSIGQMRTLGNG